MGAMETVERIAKRAIPRESPLRAVLREARDQVDLAHHALAAHAPSVIRAAPKRIYVSLTANCNFRCGACHYGREFMAGQQLPFSVGGPMLRDARAAGVGALRLYGGEPLLHREVEAYVALGAELGFNMWMTTNGLLLKKKVAGLHARGLSRLSFGFYGLGEGYDAYVERRGAFDVVESAIAYTRDRWGPDEMRMHLDWLLMRPTSDLETVRKTLDFAERYGMSLYVNLIHYSLPYFLEDGSGWHFRPEDRPALEDVAAFLIETKRARPGLVLNSEMGLRSIPDWLIKGPEMRVPCTERELLWIGADGAVQMCYVTFKLGNLHETRLKDMLFTAEHHAHARDAFALNCPNCHCSYDTRVRRHRASRRVYA